MNTWSKSWIYGILGALALGRITLLAAEPAKPAEKVLMKENRVWEWQGNAFIPAVTNLSVANIVLVKTNGQFTVGNGKERQLKEGQLLNPDLTLLSPDGTIEPVIDHVLMKAGKLLLVRDGEARALSQTYTFGNQAQVLTDGMFIEPRGRRFRLIDGQMVKLDGSLIPVKDTIVLRNGQVTVQKDGSTLRIPSNGSIVMNDGTKVFGNGRLVFFDGQEDRLQEGEIVIVDGVVKLR
jgi:hypothetical protein